MSRKKNVTLRRNQTVDPLELYYMELSGEDKEPAPTLVAKYKYAMILVHIDSTDKDDVKETYQLVELYSNETSEDYTSFVNTKLLSPKELHMAASDVSKDGPNRWFYENGTFRIKANGGWDWTENSEEERPIDSALSNLKRNDAVSEYEETIELYKTYGGD